MDHTTYGVIRLKVIGGFMREVRGLIGPMVIGCDRKIPIRFVYFIKNFRQICLAHKLGAPTIVSFLSKYENIPKSRQVLEWQKSRHLTVPILSHSQTDCLQPRQSVADESCHCALGCPASPHLLSHELHRPPQVKISDR